MSSDGVHLTMQERRRKRRGWMRGQDMRGKSSEKNTTKKIIIRAKNQDTRFISDRVLVVKDHRKRKKSRSRSKKISKIRCQKREDILGIQSRRWRARSRSNLSRGDDRSRESSGYRSSEIRRTRTCQFLCYFYWCWHCGCTWTTTRHHCEGHPSTQSVSQIRTTFLSSPKNFSRLSLSQKITKKGRMRMNGSGGTLRERWTLRMWNCWVRYATMSRLRRSSFKTIWPSWRVTSPKSNSNNNSIC